MKTYKSALCNLNNGSLTIQTYKTDTFCIPNKLYQSLLKKECQPANTQVIGFNNRVMLSMDFKTLHALLATAEQRDNYGQPSTIWVFNLLLPILNQYK